MKKNEIIALTNSDEYELSSTEKKLFEAMLDPANRFLNITELCQTAGISRDSYYRLMKKPEVRDYIHSTAIDLIKENAIRLVHAGVQFALEGSAQHFRIIMEMGGLYREKKNPDPKGEQIIQVQFVDPDGQVL